jgi:hypothetical protein
MYVSTKDRKPALGNFLICPVIRTQRIYLDDQVDVITHHRVGVDSYGEDSGQREDAVLNPIFAVLEGSPRVLVKSAKKSATYAARHAVINALHVRGYVQFSRITHADRG